jgi:hypothetical protein
MLQLRPCLVPPQLAPLHISVVIGSQRDRHLSFVELFASRPSMLVFALEDGDDRGPSAIAMLFHTDDLV